MLGIEGVHAEPGRGQRLVDRNVENALVVLRPIFRVEVHGQNKRRKLHMILPLSAAVENTPWTGSRAMGHILDDEWRRDEKSRPPMGKLVIGARQEGGHL